jgi:O-antigen/teichoic acid export membrane protein
VAEGVLTGSPVGRVARGGVTAFGIFAAGAGLTYCSQLLIARIAGVEAFGVYSYVFAWVVVLAYCSALGFDVALLRLVPAYQAERAWGLVKGVIRYAERCAITVGIVIIATGVLVVLVATSGRSPELTRSFVIAFALVPVWALLWIRSAVVRAYGGVASALVPDRIVRDGLLFGFVALASFGLGWTIDAPWLMGATLLSSTIGLALASVAMRRLRPDELNYAPPKYEARRWSLIAFPILVIGAAEALLNRTGVLLLGWSGHTADAGVYGLAFNIAFLAALPRMAINTLFAPTISNLFARKERATLQVLIAISASWTLLGAAGIAIVLSALAGPLLNWFGHGYEAGIPALRILLAGQAFAASNGSQLHIMTMTGHERGAAVLIVASTLLNAVLSIVFIDRLALTGAAIATTTTLIVWNVAMAVFIWRRLQLLPGVLGLPHGYSRAGVRR